MIFSLVVVRAFGAYAPGDAILDEPAIRAVMGSEHAGHVVRIARAEPKEG